MSKKAKISGAVTASAFIGAFVSRWVDKSMSLDFPADLILLIISGIILFFIVYKVAGDLLLD